MRNTLREIVTLGAFLIGMALAAQPLGNPQTWGVLQTAAVLTTGILGSWLAWRTFAKRETLR